MERWMAKVLCLFGTFILPLVCTILPYKVSGCIASRGASGKRVLSYLMCLGGGIFFGTYLLHMGPEVQKILKVSLLDPYHIEYPVAELVVGIGFFIVLFAEKVVLRWNKRRLRHKRRECLKAKAHQQHAATVRGDVVANDADGMAVTVLDRSRCARPATMAMCPECIRGDPCSGFDEHERKTGLNVVRNSLTGGGDHSSSARLLTPSPVIDIEDLSVCATTISSSGGGNLCPVSGTGECCSDPVPGTQKEKQIIITMKVDDCAKMNEAEVVDGSNHSHDDDDDDEVLSDVGGGHHHATRSIILILALSLHRIFEGMSIGLQHNITNVASLFGAVMCHETVIGFSLGLQFVKSGFALRRLVITSIVCSSIMPVGVLIGLAMTEMGGSETGVDIANGLLQAIAMGTFIYVTFFEILQEEVDPEDTSLAKIVFIAIGFSLMALLNLIPEEPIEKALYTTTTVIPDMLSSLLPTSTPA